LESAHLTYGKYLVPCIEINHSENKKIPRNDTIKETTWFLHYGKHRQYLAS